MSTSSKFAGFTLGLATVLGTAVVLGAAIGPTLDPYAGHDTHPAESALPDGSIIGHPPGDQPGHGH
ncbi:hypothetical protein [Nocardia fusca]|uniref:Uncharacterized protein n=1 Tax=Nocardia fusca TaxID=941183 RepID=A0ABV3F1W3_9NOCA